MIIITRSWEGGWATKTSRETFDAYCMIHEQVTVEGLCHGKRDHPECGEEGYGG